MRRVQRNCSKGQRIVSRTLGLGDANLEAPKGEIDDLHGEWRGRFSCLLDTR